MISSITLKNFKAFKTLTLNLTTLNVLVGLNGSGKSSVIQCLLLLRQSFRTELKQHIGLILQGELVHLGSGKDIFYQYAGKDGQVIFDLSFNDITARWCFEYAPQSDILPIGAVTMDEDYAAFSLFNRHFQYLNAEHIAPQVSYQKSEFNVVQHKNIGTKGEYAAHYLSEYGASEVVLTDLQHPHAKTTSLLHQVDAWVSEISPGVKFIPEDIGSGLDIIRLVVKFETEEGYTDEVKLINTGFGIGYVLPVVLAILKARAGDMLILENPESHLHPRGQSTIGRMIAYAAQAGVNIFVETHSDHIINGIRVAVKESKLTAKQVKIFHFDRVSNNYEQYSEAGEIRVDKFGELSHYPKGFLDEWTEQLMKLF